MKVNNFSESNIIIEARYTDQLNFDVVNKLAKENSDFEDFIRNINRTINSNEIEKLDYNKVYDIESLTTFFGID